MTQATRRWAGILAVRSRALAAGFDPSCSFTCWADNATFANGGALTIQSTTTHCNCTGVAPRGAT
jgi:hypothetical protein